MRTTYDLEMLREVGFCSGIENSTAADGRAPGEALYTLLDYFPDDWLCVIDEVRITVPQIHGMYEGPDPKETLVEFGSGCRALDNRPLRFDEFVKKVNQTVYMSATPLPYEPDVQPHRRADRPPHGSGGSRSGRPTRGQVDDDRGDPQAGRGRPAGPGHHAHEEDGRGLTGLPARDGHPRPVPAFEVGTIQRIEIIRDLRRRVRRAGRDQPAP